jgi:hypothetical protein
MLATVTNMYNALAKGAAKTLRWKVYARRVNDISQSLSSGTAWTEVTSRIAMEDFPSIKASIENELGQFKSDSIQLQSDGVQWWKSNFIEPVGVIPSSGLVAWFKADAIVGLNDGDSVYQWNDQSGSNNHAVQNTTAQRPIYKTNIQNGLPVLRFDGTDDNLILNNNISNTVGTMFVVAKKTSGTSYRALLIGGKFGVYARGGTDQWLTYMNVDLYSTQQLSTVFKCLSLVVRNYNDVDLVTNGITFVNKTNGTAFNTKSSSVIGADPGGVQQHNGDIAEIVWYSRALTTAEREQVEDYLIAKYNLNPV